MIVPYAQVYLVNLKNLLLAVLFIVDHVLINGQNNLNKLYFIQHISGVSKNNCCQKYTITNLSEQLQRNYNNLQLRCLNCQQEININLIDQHEIECSTIKQRINFEYCGNIIPQDNNDLFCDSKLLVAQSSEKQIRYI